MSNEEKEEDTSNKLENHYNLIDKFIQLNTELAHVDT